MICNTPALCRYYVRRWPTGPKGLLLKSDSDGMRVQCGLNPEETAQLHALAGLCRELDGVDVKFNYGMISHRDPRGLYDFCWFHQGELVGYVPLDNFGNKCEITAAVHPEFRRQGIFSQLYTAAVEQARRQECVELLLVSYRKSESGTAAVNRLGLRYKFSEYCMVTAAADTPQPTSADITLTDVTSEHVEELSRMLAVSFPDSGWGAPADLLKELAEPGKRYYLAKLADEAIGHIGVAIGKHETYIRGVGIMPEWRRKGYGRQMLAETLRREHGAGAANFELDVATENEGALNIYMSCGFKQSNVYDYYVVF